MKRETNGHCPWHQKRFQVRLFEAGPNGRTRVSSLLNYFQEAAGEHAALLGVSVTDLLPKKKLTWVLSRYHIRIWRYPLWSETVELKTWPSARQDYFALREFELHGAQGELLAAATSSWMMIDRQTKRPVLLAGHLPAFEEDNRRAVDDRFDPLPGVEKIDLQLSLQVGLRDLDWNKHVNHVVYIEWALETAPTDLLTDYLPVEIEVDYRGEAFLGETILSSTGCLLHRVAKKDNDRELARLRTKWRKKPMGEEIYRV